MADKSERILRRRVVEDKVGLRHSQIHYLETQGKFPRRIKISERASGWLETEIEAWILQRVAASRGEASGGSR